MDIGREVGKRFNSAANKSARRVSHGPKSKSPVRRGEREDAGARLMDKILKAGRPERLQKPKPKLKPKDDGMTARVTPPAPESVERRIMPVPKDSAGG